MRIKIIDKQKCDKCTQRTCSINNTVSKSDFYNLKTEQYTCPMKIFVYGLTDEQMEKGYVDFNLANNECLYCCLCAIQCSQENLKIENYEYDARADFLRLKECGQRQAEGPSNIIALSYLNIIFEFAANTNLIKPLSFDGAFFNNKNEPCMVEVDINNDSLECCRRLLADITLHNHKNENKVYNGLMVLNDFPKDGSRDVYTLLQKIYEYEKTAGLKIYITTFSLLRYLAINHRKDDDKSFNIFYNPSLESKDKYLDRLAETGIITTEMKDMIF